MGELDSRLLADEPSAASARRSWTTLQRAKNSALYAMARAAAWVVGRLPLGMALRLGGAVGLLGWALAAGERRKVLAGLATAFPERSEPWRRSLARRCFAHLGRSAAEVTRLTRGGSALEEWVTRHVAMPDRDLIDDQLSEGRGLVWVTAHFNNWELLAAGLGVRGYDVRPVAKESYDPRLTAMIDGWRRSVGVTTIWRGDRELGQKVGRALGRGAIVGVLMDQDTRVRGAFVPFFGRPAWTPTGAAELARIHGAPVVAGFIWPRPEGGHVVRVEAVEMQRTGDATTDDLENTTRLTRAIEEAVRRRPEGWVWMHERWRTRPDGVKGEGS